MSWSLVLFSSCVFTLLALRVFTVVNRFSFENFHTKKHSAAAAAACWPKREGRNKTMHGKKRKLLFRVKQTWVVQIFPLIAPAAASASSRHSLVFLHAGGSIITNLACKNDGAVHEGWATVSSEERESCPYFVRCYGSEGGVLRSLRAIGECYSAFLFELNEHPG